MKAIYYSRENAKAAAEKFASENNGIVQVSKYGADHRTNFDYEDDDMQSMCWSGEVAAFEVIGNDNYEVIGLFAYWC